MFALESHKTQSAQCVNTVAMKKIFACLFAFYILFITQDSALLLLDKISEQVCENNPPIADWVLTTTTKYQRIVNTISNQK